MNKHPHPTSEREAKIKKVLSQRQKDLTLVLANIHDPHNVSAIYRSCDAFGIPHVHLYYTHTEFPKLGAKSSASARKWVDSIRHTTIESLKLALTEQPSMQILATNCSPSAKPVTDYDFTKPTSFILGNEHGGVDSELFSIATGEIYIPMYGMIQSFNVSVAAAILLAEAARQRQQADQYANSTYSPEELQILYDNWVRR